MRRIFRNVMGVLLLLLLFEAQASAHGVPLPLIVDTDMALDDMRAITMLLNSEMVEIPLFVTSDGALSPREGAKKLNAILNYFDKGSIPVSEGETLSALEPPWRSWTREIQISQDRGGPDIKLAGRTAPNQIVTRINSSESKVLYLCLGPMTNLADALRLDPNLKEKISMILYVGGFPEDDRPGWNSRRDPAAARKVFDSGIRIYAMNLPDDHLPAFDIEFFERIAVLKTPASQLIEDLHSTSQVKTLLEQSHFHMWDEMAIIYMSQPSLFTFLHSVRREHVMLLESFEKEEISDFYLKLLGHSADFHLSPRQSVVLKAFPDNPKFFRKDIHPYVQQIIERYGYEEWKACLLTNELHRHLGIYSLIGAKMGVRAREILEAPYDTLKVISYAGLDPPLSCMNDGLQVSTGASLGRGTIKVTEREYRPAAAFLCDNTELELSLKEDVWKGIKNEIRMALDRFGGLNPAYFSHIRKRSIQYWHDLDRREIFDERMKQLRVSN